MTAHQEELELRDRLSLIENMIAEGRRRTESWGWTFVLWGMAYIVAIAWSNWGHNPYAWLITMMSTLVLHFVIIGLRHGKQSESKPDTTLGRAMWSMWMALGVSMMLLFPALGFSGRFNQQIFFAIVASMLGLVNGASGILLRWKAQVASACVWWLTSILCCFSTENQSTLVFLGAIFLCQIVFGGYAMWRESRVIKMGGAHA